MGKAFFEGRCPYCGNKVIGSWDWDIGDICVQGFCEVCNIYLLEDEVNWMPTIIQGLRDNSIQTG